MKINSTIRLVLASTLLLGSLHTRAQDLQSAYFLNGNAYGHEMNPAREYDRKGYFSLPFLPGQMNVGTGGNLNIKDLFYKNPDGSGLVTYLHPSISTDKAMSGFSRNNKLFVNERVDLLSFGFHALQGYNTFTLGIRSNVAVNLPYELFDITKNLTNQDYNISKLGGTATAWAELALGHSHQISEAWRFGAKAKILLGGAYARAKMNDLSLKLADEDRWTAQANASLELGMHGLYWDSPNPEESDIEDLDIDKPGLGGGGLAVDLGAEWDMDKTDIVRGLKLGAALIDLGFIRWKNVAVAQNDGEKFVFEGFQHVNASDSDSPESLKNQIEDLGDRLEKLYNLQAGGITSKTRTLGATVNLSAEYTLQSYDKLKLGFLSTTRIQGVYSWNEERVSMTLSPCKAFEIAGSWAAGTRGVNLGWIINVHPKGFNLFVGSDHCIGRVSKQFIPLRSNYDFCMGVNFPLGKNIKWLEDNDL